MKDRSAAIHFTNRILSRGNGDATSAGIGILLQNLAPRLVQVQEEGGTIRTQSRPVQDRAENRELFGWKAAEKSV